ncbi:MAG: hypothetical protein QM817_28110 [Archangium sp.]
MRRLAWTCLLLTGCLANPTVDAGADAGVEARDASVTTDAGTDAGVDAGVDAGTTTRDGGYTHAPAGLHTIVDWHDEATLAPAGWTVEANDPNPFSGGTTSRVTSGYEVTPVIGGPAVVQMQFPDLAPGSFGPGRLNADLRSFMLDEVFIGCEFQFASDYMLSDQSNKIFFVQWGPAPSRAYVTIRDQPLLPAENMVVEVSMSGNPVGGFQSPNVGGADGDVLIGNGVRIAYGQLITLEWYFRRNTGTGDGVMQLWVNGALAIDERAMNFPPGFAYAFYSEFTNNGNHLPMPSDPRIISPRSTAWLSDVTIMAR